MKLIKNIKLILIIYSHIFKIPGFLNKVRYFCLPLDFVRYTEFNYILDFIKINNLKFTNILDISSPFLLAYILSNKNNVIKTDINTKEGLNIKSSNSLSFQKENAINLSFKDNSFDFVYSISVIEHIYKNYIKAIEEMVRVCKNNGYIYITCPVCYEHIEEWVDKDPYSDQYKNNEKTFFQYRFNEKDIKEIESIKNLKLVKKDIFWEKKCGLFDYIIAKLNILQKNKSFLNILKIIFINFYYGFSFFNKSDLSFEKNKKFGNIHFIFNLIK